MIRTAVICPSRDDVEGLLSAHRSMVATSTDAVMIAVVDSDQTAMYDTITATPDDRLIISYGTRDSRGGVVASINAAIKNNPGFDVYGLMVCDARIETPGWENWVASCVARFPNRIGLMSAHHNVGRFVNFPYVTREWIDAVGWYACPDTFRFCWDTVAEMLGDATAIEYAEEKDFHIEHELRRNDNTVNVFATDAIQFLGWCVNGRREAVSRLKAAIAVVKETT